MKNSRSETHRSAENAGAPQANAARPTQDHAAQQPWHVLDHSKIEEMVGTNEHGLGITEVATRRARYGPNLLEEAPPPSVFEIFLHQFRSPLIYILLVATAITLFLGDYIDAGVIGAVLMLNAIIGFVQEYRASIPFGA